MNTKIKGLMLILFSLIFTVGLANYNHNDGGDGSKKECMTYDVNKSCILENKVGYQSNQTTRRERRYIKHLENRPSRDKVFRLVRVKTQTQNSA